MFRTEINPHPSPNKIGLNTALLTIGSCFSDHIGQQLLENKFDVLTSPFGVIFNPISINKLLKIATTNGEIDISIWVQSQGIHLHYDVHSQLGSIDKQEAENNMSEAIYLTHSQLQKTKWLIITWGTAIVYERKDNGEIVANCHKVPAEQFTKRLLSNKEIIADFEGLLSALPKDINVLLTVSPVRHLKETLELNSVSKSTLRLACHQLSQQHDQVSYFPAYELMLDDLRDYRFYKSDMLHPSEEAIKYVWKKFSDAYFEKGTLDFIEQWFKIQSAIKHKPFNPKSNAHQQFIKKTINTMNELKNGIDVSTEINHLQQQLTNQ